MVHLDDGSVTYPNTISVSRLNTTNADNKLSWSLQSTDDADFQVAGNPSKLGRKSKGTEFVKDPPLGRKFIRPAHKTLGVGTLDLFGF